MRLLDRVRDAFDAPRFCPDDGKAIRVQNIPAFDAGTGAKRDRWFWACPEVYVSPGWDSINWSQSGDHVHVHGQGRPRWHAAAQPVQEDAP